MSNSGFYISALSVRGRGKDTAEVTLSEGLNVIAGASDTGKTYIFECINYVFGSTVIPKQIVEGNGYTEVLIELTTREGTFYTLRRNFADGKMYKYDCDLAQIENESPTEIGNQHSKDDVKNYSSFLLSLIGAPYKNVAKNKGGHTTSFSYRDFIHITMLHEKKIIDTLSPIYSEGSRFTKTRNESVFKTIMTGNDDSVFEGNKKNDTEKIRSRLKIDFFEDRIVTTRIKIEELNAVLKRVEFNIGDFDKSIANLKIELSKKQQTINTLEREKQEVWGQLQFLRSDAQLLRELRSRFSLLKKNYSSDIERLSFIEEADFYLGQLIDVKCPTCNSEIPMDYSEVQQQSLAAEIHKIKFQIQDLNETIDETEIKITKKENEIKEIEANISKIDRIIKEELKPVLENFNFEIDELIILRDKYIARELYESELNELILERDILKNSVSTHKDSKEIDRDINENSIRLFITIIKELLTEWKLEEDINVTFDRKTNDIIVNGKSKGTFGKGYAAILNSAFVIGILKFTSMVGLAHPKVIVLDSPLTTFKEKDNSIYESNVNDEVKQAFFKYLSNQNTGMQFIVLDNAEPSETLRSRINYYHFSKNKNVGRYGFIPINK